MFIVIYIMFDTFVFHLPFKIMKSKILFPLLPLLALFFWQGCKSDPCENVSCDHGVCSDGECQCETGWKGADCSVYDCDARCGHGSCFDDSCYCDLAYVGEHCETCGVAKFYGTYHSTATCDSFYTTYLFSIPDNGCYQDFSLEGALTAPTITQKGAVILNDMTNVTFHGLDQNGYAVTFGQGSINAAGTQINGTYEYTDTQGTVHTCTLVMVKQ